MQLNRKKKDLDATQIEKHEKEVLSVMSTLESAVDPFEGEQTELVHLTSGLVATEDVKSDLLTAKERGEQHLQMFINDKLQVPNPDIFSAIKKLKLKTFSSMTKKVKVKSKNGAEAMLKSNRDLFARMLLLAKSRNIDVKEVLSFPLAPFPLSLATEMGTLHKTQKCKLLMLIEDSMENATLSSVPEGNALILDGMAIIQSMKKLPSSFGELADQLLRMVINLGLHHKSLRVDFVIDTYPDTSIKNLERSARASDGVAIITVYGAEQKLPTQWIKFLKHGKNKEALVQFLFTHWCTYHSGILHGLTLYVCHSDQCHKLSPAFENNEPVIVQRIDELCCDHEEADTRMMLHASHASQFENVVIKSPDTDVFVLLVHFSLSFTFSPFFVTGVKEHVRIININAIAQSLGEDKCKALIGFHAFTGKYLPVHFHIFSVQYSKQQKNHRTHKNIFILKPFSKHM